MADTQPNRPKGWRKYFKVANVGGQMSPLSGAGGTGLPGYGRNTGSAADDGHAHANMVYRNYASRLPEVYTGHPNRVERYNQYEAMDMDSEINACLDILAEFSTQADSNTGLPFRIDYSEKPTDNEVRILQQQLRQWCKLNRLQQRIFRIFRNTLKYGDQVFVRDPETFEMYWVDMTKVARVIVNESEGKQPEQYVIRDINPNFQNMTVAAKTTTDYQSNPPSSGYVAPFNYVSPTAGQGGQGTGQSRFSAAMNEAVLDAKHIVHLSLTEGLDFYWPFGQSVLETIFRVFKQKELLEDSVLIYRVARAPERRVFKIDVGNMPSHLAMQFVERVKNEIHQRRIPSKSGGGSNIMDSSYNPLSVNEDYFFPQTCLSLDTRIKLLDNRDLSLGEIIAEYQTSKRNFVYSVNQHTLEIEPGEIIWAGITRRSAQVLRVTLDNGESVITTPDHRFIMRDGSERTAQDLKAGDSVMPLYLHDATTGKHQSAGKYLRYTCPATGKKKWVHTMVCPKKNSSKLTEIHHINLNSLDNSPTNLIEMSVVEHRELHRQLGTYHLSRAWNQPDSRQKLLAGIRHYHANVTESDKQMFAERGRTNGANTWLRQESAARVKQALAETRKRVALKRTIQISDGMCERMTQLFAAQHDSVIKMCRALRSDEIFQARFREANTNLLRDRNRSMTMMPTDKSLNRMASNLGYASWGDFKENYRHNHQIVSIEWLEQPVDTGDITVKTSSGSHNFALSSGIFVHNSDGRGSSVETLPGGSNLGEIDDLKYFNNKMCRGLRVPSSYLPTGPDDSDRPLSDGRVGTALIQEYRFNQYCERLQRLVIEKLDDEFKMFMRWRGFNIDAGLFSISFNPPQNFASYREAELDTTRVSTFTSLDALPYFSKRFLLKRYLGLTEEEIKENEELWHEERDKPESPAATGQDLRSVGVTPADLESDIMTGQELAGLGEPGELTAAPGTAPGQQPAAGAGAPALGAPPAVGAAPTV
jgi:hypothetical protein